MFSANSSQVSSDTLYVEDVFSTYLYTATGSSFSINNSIDLSGKGGLVWIKDRSTAITHRLFDTARGVNQELATSTTNGQASRGSSVTAFLSNGFTIGTDGGVNTSPDNYASWTFRKAPKFFDVVTFTVSSTSVFNHSLGSIPGCIIIKSTSSANDWFVVHRGANGFAKLNTTGANSGSFPGIGTSGAYCNCTATTFDVSNFVSTGETYVAYLFAHDATSDGIIQCGSFTTDGSGNGSPVSLGWEPQSLTIKASTTTSDWLMWDNMRGWTAGGSAQTLRANSANAETSNNGAIYPTSTGFGVQGLVPSTTYIYIAIRRGPMKTPTSGTSVFAPVALASPPGATVTTNFPIDMVWLTPRTSGVANVSFDRLRGFKNYLGTTSTASEQTDATGLGTNINNVGWTNAWLGSASGITWNFRRAPSFFDEVCYTGNATSNRAINHNLGAVPELMIIKRRSASGTGWATYSAPTGIGKVLILNTTDAAQSIPGFYDTAPTATTFTIEASGWTNTSGETYVAYLFASCSGVSKVGSYTGNGSSQTINCGFAGGARFILIKRTDSTGDWYVWDTARGIVAANDPHLSLNTTAAEVTTDDSIDPDSSGFVVNQVSATNINVSSATYIYLAVA